MLLVTVIALILVVLPQLLIFIITFYSLTNSQSTDAAGTALHLTWLSAGMVAGKASLVAV